MVLGAYYAIYSMDIPDTQTNGTLNLCYRSMGSQVRLHSGCHYFKVVHGFLNSNVGKFPLAFESACLPGYYLVEKNYKLILAPKEKTSVFGN